MCMCMLNFVAREFMNVIVNVDLEHGKKYVVCVHAIATVKEHEKWTEIFEEENVCSDGVVVDLTSPTPGKLWFETVPGTEFQVCTTLLDTVPAVEFQVNSSGL